MPSHYQASLSSQPTDLNCCLALYWAFQVGMELQKTISGSLPSTMVAHTTPKRTLCMHNDIAASDPIPAPFLSLVCYFSICCRTQCISTGRHYYLPDSLSKPNEHLYNSVTMPHVCRWRPEREAGSHCCVNAAWTLQRAWVMVALAWPDAPGHAAKGPSACKAEEGADISSVGGLLISPTPQHTFVHTPPQHAPCIR